MATLESKIERTACAKILNELGVANEKFGQHGYPDRLFFVPGGRPFFIEFKRPGEVPEPLQVHRHNMLRLWGYEVQTHDNVADAFNAVRCALQAAQLPEDGHQVLA